MPLASTLPRRDHAGRPPVRSTFDALVALPHTLLQQLADYFDAPAPAAATPLPVAGARDARDMHRTATAMSRAWHPDVEVFRRRGRMIIRAEVPGFAASDIAVRLERDQLTISGMHQHPAPHDYVGPTYSDRAFFRAIPILDGTDATDCNATFHDGVLEVALPIPVVGAMPGREIAVTA